MTDLPAIIQRAVDAGCLCRWQSDYPGSPDWYPRMSAQCPIEDHTFPGAA